MAQASCLWRARSPTPTPHNTCVAQASCLWRARSPTPTPHNTCVAQASCLWRVITQAGEIVLT
ncbi:hypothetical protein QUB28_27600 [Microcoleus sp. B4-C3]|uniref:hypothetical protein n=1 Tax=Microcoleus sp. B4-C2 TaxID=2818661 RepID=UPI002FD14D6E